MQYARDKSGLKCDLLVVGSGAGGLSTAITAKLRGLDIIVIEKEAVFGGTTAFSGGVLWVPLSRHSRNSREADSKESLDEVRRYLRHEVGNFYRPEFVEAFLKHGPEMVEFFEDRAGVKFLPTEYPDYHPDAPGGALRGRSIVAAPFNAASLGSNLGRLRGPLETITFMGMMFNSSSADLKHFFNVTRSVASLIYVIKRMSGHLVELLVHGRGVQVTGGNALAASLAKSAIEHGVEILAGTEAKELTLRDGAVSGVRVLRGADCFDISSRYGVVLATGGFSHDRDRIKEAYPHVGRGGDHFSPVPKGNTGDGARLAESAGGRVTTDFPQPAAWMPVSRVPMAPGRDVAFPHLLDRYKPGVIGVLKNGKRFTNESNSYHDVGVALIDACKGSAETCMWLICDSNALRKYGLGYVKPAPIPHSKMLKNGYLTKGDSVCSLAEELGIDAGALESTVREYNEHARRGVDIQFRRGTTAFNRFLGDPNHQPNPCVAPIERGPYYAVKVVLGDLGTFDGIETSVFGEVVRGKEIVPGLYAVGNDRASLMGGTYPGAGITLGPIMTFGYITANRIADRAEGSSS
ncbi:FAD-dependent oxidoreductase [Paraburkholderia graminis]|uniref:FAD-dependent oxidoreductase n=1 Tax=Paraburkholderia graminis TaxID=60548 RepID=UPI0038BD3E14